MQFNLLDVKSEGGAQCRLIRASLDEYLSSLPDDYASYDIQRAIVSNSYLDKLVLTVINNRHIPSITLIVDNENGLAGGRVDSYKILDGLQRTHRLRIINETRKFFLAEIAPISRELSDFQLKRNYRDQLISIGSSGFILMELRKFFESSGKEALERCFSENYQWFEVWTGLGPAEQVQKMLLLNAGHKPVNIRHQLELLFNNIYTTISEVKAGHVRISREKQVTSSSHSKQRKVGDFHFSHVISALISFVEKKPITAGSDFIESIQSDKEKYNDLVDFFSFDFLQNFVNSLYRIDVAAAECFGDAGVQWMGRDTSLSAMFAALGAHAESDLDLVGSCELLVANFNKCNLVEYEQARKILDLAKVNIGAVSKRIIFRSFISFVESSCSDPISWYSAFEGDR